MKYLIKELKLILAMPDDLGLVKKGVIKGKLPISDDWQFIKSYNVVDNTIHGDGQPEICDNCARPIKYIVILESPDMEVHVGADCAEALVSGATKEKVEQFIKNEKKLLLLIRKTYKNLLSKQEFYSSVSLEKLQEQYLNESYLPKKSKLEQDIQFIQSLHNISSNTESEIKAAIRRGFLIGAYHDDSTAIKNPRGKTLFDFI